MLIPQAIVQQGAAGAVTVISDQTLGGTAASFDLTSIPGTYKDLWLIVSGRTDHAVAVDKPTLRMNNDSGSNYSYGAYQTVVGGAGPTPSESYGDTKISVAEVTGTSAPANGSAQIEIFISDYAGTTFYKNVYAFSHGYYATGASSGGMQGYTVYGVWLSTSAITRLTLAPESGNFIAGSRCTLYGVG